MTSPITLKQISLTQSIDASFVDGNASPAARMNVHYMQPRLSQLDPDNPVMITEEDSHDITRPAARHNGDILSDEEAENAGIQIDESEDPNGVDRAIGHDFGAHHLDDEGIVSRSIETTALRRKRIASSTMPNRVKFTL